MRLELQFNESIYRKQMELLYQMGSGKKKRYYKNSNYFGFVFIIMGTLVIAGKGNIGYLFVLLGLGTLISYYRFYFKQKKLTQKYEAEQVATIALLLENPKAVFEFNEEGLTYSDHTGKQTFYWNEFLTYIIKDDNIFLITKKFHPFALGKSEMGNENYSDVVNFIELKLEKKQAAN